MRPLPLLALLSACSEPTPPDFPPGLEPLAENQAEAPTGTEADPYPEALNLLVVAEDPAEVHGRGFVHAGPEEVAQALQTPAVCVDRRKVLEWEVTWDVEPEFEVSYRIHNIVEDIITVDFDVDWRHGSVVEDDDGNLVLGASRWQKTDGTTFIDVLEGSVVIEQLPDGHTSIDIVERIDAIQDPTADAQSYIQDLYDDVVATVHGEALQEFEH